MQIFNKILVPVLLTLTGTVCAAVRPPQNPAEGKVTRHEVYSPQMQETLIVDVWTPKDYEVQFDNSYPVIYMNDGQNAYDPNGSFAGKAWDIDDVISQLHTAGHTENAVVVGVHCTANRFGDYSPSKALSAVPGLVEKMQNVWGSTIKGDEYLKFLTETLMPQIEASYRVRKDLRSTSIIGSSMGGLISLYAICEYPEIFGNAACLSTHWIGALDNSTPEFPEAVMEYLKANLPSPENHRIYLDHGAFGLDAYYPKWNVQAVEIAESTGFEDEYTLMNYVDESGDHNEVSWKKRLDKPLTFILKAMTPALSPEGVEYDLPKRIGDGLILHCFDWKLEDIRKELPRIAAAGFKAIQTSPMQRNVPSGAIWYDVYRPYDYRFIDNSMGTREDMHQLCADAAKLGIAVIVDIVANHGTGKNEAHSPWWDQNGRMGYGNTIDYSNRWSETHDCLGNYGESNSDDPDVQERTRNYILELKGLGVSGLRWDAAKHIGLPSEGCDFWPNVLNVPGIWNYGEILGAPAQDRSKITEYAQLMHFTDTYGGQEGWNGFEDLGVAPDRLVHWLESHDTFSNPPYTSQSMTQAEIEQAWPILAARRASTALYLSRPGLGEGHTIKVGQKGSLDFSNTVIAAANHFHNTMGLEPENFYKADGIKAVYRHKGVVIVKDGGGEVSLPVNNLDASLTYEDEITGNPFVINNEQITGSVDPQSGVAIVYDYKNRQTPEPPEDEVGGDDPVVVDKDTYVYLHFDDADYGNHKWYVFIYTDNQGTNGSWPGAALTLDESCTLNGLSGWYSYMIPKGLRYGLAMVSSSNNNYRYPGDMEPGIPINGKSIIFTHHNGVWNTDLIEGSADIKQIIDTEQPLGYGFASSLQISYPGTQVYDMCGRLVLSNTASKEYSLPAGIYILRNGARIQKIIVR